MQTNVSDDEYDIRRFNKHLIVIPFLALESFVLV